MDWLLVSNSCPFLPLKYEVTPRHIYKCFSFTSSVQNLWMVVDGCGNQGSRIIFCLCEKGIFITLCLFMLLEKCWYFSSFRLLAVSIKNSFLKFCFHNFYAQMISDLKNSCLYPPYYPHNDMGYRQEILRSEII
jgi:hypothetical protein